MNTATRQVTYSIHEGGWSGSLGAIGRGGDCGKLELVRVSKQGPYRVPRGNRWHPPIRLIQRDKGWAKGKGSELDCSSHMGLLSILFGTGSCSLPQGLCTSCFLASEYFPHGS